jgi:hypothetical protein
MPAPSVALTVASPHATLTLALSTTVQAIRIPAAVWGQISGLRVTLADATVIAGGYQVLADGALAADDTAPTTDWYPLYGQAPGQPIEAGVHNPAGSGGDVHIMVWAASGTPTLHISPAPVTR